jgi:hypothetical protein
VTKKKAPAKRKARATLPAKVQGTMALWIMTPFGVLYPAIRPPELVPEGDPRTMQVRSRRAEYIEAFRRWCPELGDAEHHPGHDYPHKAAVSPEHLATAVAAMVLATDSETFKPLSESSPFALEDDALAAALHRCYNSMWSSQLSYLSDGTSSYDPSSPAGWKGYEREDEDPDPGDPFFRDSEREAIWPKH